MSLSTPTAPKAFLPSTNDTLQQTQFRKHTAVIENDWVPAIQLSAMHHASPVRLAGPLRPMWYVDGAKKIVLKVVRLKWQTV